MRFEGHGKVPMCAAIATWALGLAGCVPNAFVYDDLPGVHPRSVGTPYPPAYYSGYPGYYSYPRYYATPRYYGYSPYPPRVVHYDRDHRDDDRDRHDRNDRDHQPQDRDGHADRRPPGAGPATDDRCAGPNKCRPATVPGTEPEPRGMRALRVKKPADADRTSEARKDLD